MSLISVKQLTFSYPHAKNKALDEVSFNIEEGSYTAIVGTNGSGKSTLARLICGLENPSSGKIEFNRKLRIGLVLQSPKDQLVSSIVSRDTAFGPQNLKLKKGEVELRTIECLNIVDLLDKANSSTNALSLGQTQKTALSGMLAIWPDVLILDEAVAMLDPESRKKIFEFLRYWHRTNHTIIHITHDMDAVKEAGQILGIEKGKVFFDGKSDDFVKDEKNEFIINGEKLPIADKALWNKTADKTNSVFEMKNVSFAYDKTEKVKAGENRKSGCVSNISFSLHKGSLTALTGPSGAGKSTLMELGAGLLGGEDGKILCRDRPVLVQQNASAALFEAFAADDVAFGPRNKGVTGKALKKIVVDAMEKTGLDFKDFGERHTNELSGGEQRRLAIAGILALEPEIIFFDEPTAGLDGKSRYKIMMLLRQLAEEGKTVVFSTHRNDEADFSDREIKMRNGKIINDSFDKVVPETELPEMTPYSSVSMLEGLRNTSLSLSGAKKNKKSPVERIFPWMRIVLFLALFILCLVTRSIYLCGGMFLISIVYCLLAGFSMKRLFKAIWKIFPFIMFFAVLQLIFHPALSEESVLFQWKWLLITPSKLIFCAASMLRTFGALACISGFFVSIPEYDLIDGLKILLFPLNVIRIPVRYFILIMEIIFRFMPLLIDECISIIKTQLIRGGLGKKKGKMAKIKALIPLIVPILLQTIKRSEALADAITMRCFK